MNNPLWGWLDDRTSISHNVDASVATEVKENNRPRARQGLRHDPPRAKESWTFSAQHQEERPFRNITSWVSMCCPLSFCVDAGEAQVPGLRTTKSHYSETNLSSVGREALSKWVLLPTEQEASTLCICNHCLYSWGLNTENKKPRKCSSKN